MSLALERNRVLSSTGCCRSFDEGADGYCRGEAVNAILIKPLDDAIRDDDPIRAIIRSTAVNCDGKSQAFSHPSAEMHEAVIRRAYEVGGIKDICQTPFVECHGTGTPIGDPIEAEGVANAFRGAETYIGSVKPNVGHSEGASGITSVIKAVLALERKTIPPNINFSKPNPKIPFEKENLKVPVEAMPWPENRPARISVNSFGVGGANAHAIIESAASFGLPQRDTGSETCSHGESGYSSPGSNERLSSEDSKRPDIRTWPRLLPLSANNAQSLRTRIEDMGRYISSRPDSLDAIAHTLGTRRDHLRHRSFCIADGLEKKQLDFTIPQKSFATAPDVAFVFTGQGAQWEGMGKELMRGSSSFRQDIRIMDHVLSSIEEGGPQWRIEDILSGSDQGNHPIDRPDYSQPLCTAIQIALVNLLVKCGIKPAAVVGHSSGEIAAAYAAGALSSADATLNAYHRGLAAKLKAREGGGMIAVGMGRDEVAPLVAHGALVACENSQKSVTLSGDRHALEKSVDAIKAEYPNVFTRLLPLDVAYHSSHMSEAGNRILETTKPCQHQKTTVPFYSSLTGELVPVESQLPPTYWRDNLVSPVLFSGAIHGLLHDLRRETVLLEIGPHSALQGPILQILKANSGKPAAYVSTLTRHTNSVFSVLAACGQVYAHGYDIDFSFINPRATTLTDLPNYPWDHTSEYWKESRITKAWKEKKHCHHELLGSRCLESSDSEPIWRNRLKIADTPWLNDHRILDACIFPCTAYVATFGEAIRQTTGSEAYRLRNMAILSALVLPESDEKEILTSMRPLRLTQDKESSWFELSLSSFDGTNWTKHCIAEGRAGEEMVLPEQATEPFPRQVTGRSYYQRQAKFGARFGPRFRGLHDISAQVTEKRAKATIYHEFEPEANYPAHPTTLDSCIQLGIIAKANGLARRMEKAWVPSTIELISVNPGPSRVVCESTASCYPSTFESQSVAVAGSIVVAKFEKIVWVSIQTGDEALERQAALGSRPEWRPSIDFLDSRRLTYHTSPKPETSMLLERYSTLCILHMTDILSSCQRPSGQWATLAAWVRAEQQAMIRKKGTALVPEAKKWAVMSASARASLRTAVGKELEAIPGNEASSVLTLCRQISEQDLTRENSIEDPSLGERTFGNMTNYAELFSLYAHARPEFRILQLGAGSGGATQAILDSLTTSDGGYRYSQYTCADSSYELLKAAKRRLKMNAKMEIKVLDITQDPAQQGFDLGHYDVIVASNTLRNLVPATSPDALRNIRSLLRPGGRLLLQELVRPIRWRWVKFIKGFLNQAGVGDALEKNDGVCDEQWDKVLRQAGFSGCDTVVPDNTPSHAITSHIIATAAHSTQGPREDVISFLDIEDPFFHDMSPAQLEAFVAYMSKFEARMLWLTRPVQICCTDPRYGPSIGMARTIRAELGVGFRTIELQNLDSTAEEAVVNILKFPQRLSEAYDAESEFALHQGTIHTSRYQWFPLSRELESPTPTDAPKRLVVEQSGSVDNLHWHQDHTSPAGIGDDQVELDVRCTGLNFRDLLIAMGIITSSHDGLGYEASGVVTRTGAAIENVKVGDRVMTVSTGCFATRLRVHGQLVAPLPEGLSFEQGASIPLIFLTVVYSLVNVGQLSKGQSILIHSACGGIGLAAIQVCRMLEAKIYTTVGNEEKVQYLVNNFGLSSEQIFDSHSTSFQRDLLDATDGRGVDVVLNSLSGELLHASWNCVAKYGKMIEIGKRDLLGRGQLDLEPFLHNRTYCGVDLITVMEDRPEVVQRTLNQVVDYICQGHIKPVQTHVFPASEIPEAFRYMQTGRHIGKIVVTLPEDEPLAAKNMLPRQTSFSRDATYLLAGGLGGLGRAVATWMVERGAGNLLLLSRSGGESPSAKAFLQELECQGCRAVAVACDISDFTAVQEAMKAAPTPIAGVLQFAMSVEDRAFSKLSYQDWDAAQKPKVDGTWNLHKALLGAPDVDFFVLFGSLLGTCGNPGQANYTAANSFLDAFVQFRQNLGLPCSIVDIGVMSDIGFLLQDIKLEKYLRDMGWFPLQESHLLEGLQIAIHNAYLTKGDQSCSVYRNSGQILVGLASTKSLSDPSNHLPWKRDIRMSRYQPLQSSDQSSDTPSCHGVLGNFLQSVANSPEMLDDPASLDIVTEEIGRAVCGFLALSPEDVDRKANLNAKGLDSLVGIEVRNWWNRTFGLDNNVFSITSAGTVENLGKKAIASLKEKY
ncbi:hypothetical protein XA68_18210 [Ophiocordyceps unilateralis]|uniref:Uncharacterized protein n=1 Tax=Ophiocordyceps unilateralis TaxID=268505 RepID=A0A2A9PRC8_OPHUN|nr:hypothetical protein XA68_18210 [Ophiocordyceps unilateralis]